MSQPDPSDACARLGATLRPLVGEGVALAYSGGVDSAALLAALAALRRERDFPLLALTFHSPLQRTGEAAEAAAFPRALGVPWRVVEADPLACPDIAANPPDRCYRCKRLLLAALRAAAPGLGTLLDGTNADDRRAGDRPGLRAVAELGVRSPLAEAGLSKAEVRALARSLGVPDPDRPAAPCLATRIPFGEALTAARLRRVEAAEAALRTAFPEAEDLRLRDHCPSARLELPPILLPLAHAHAGRLLAALRPLGFHALSLAPLHPPPEERTQP